MKKELYLIYVHKIGYDYSGNWFYEFIFGESETLKNVDGENWDSTPAKGNPEPPFTEFIKQVGKISTDINLDVVQDSDTFCMYDSVDKVMALAWENIDGLEDYPEPRLAFRFGMPIKEVGDLLYERDLVMECKFELEDE